ncbi:MAG: pinensin family lanthipeptide [Bacteroidota bacterium]
MKKLMLKDLKVKSFVTDLKAESSNTVKGGTGTLVTLDAGCETSPIICNLITLPFQCEIKTLAIPC